MAAPRHGLNISDLPPVCHLHFAADDTQILIIQTADVHVTIRIRGALISLGATDLSLVANGWSALDRHASAFEALAHAIVRRRLAFAADRPGAGQANWIRNGLMAFDGERAGVSQRLIARAIYGADAEANTWRDRDGWLRSAVRRDIRRGRRLIETGWRELVAGGSDSTNL